MLDSAVEPLRPPSLRPLSERRSSVASRGARNDLMQVQLGAARQQSPFALKRAFPLLRLHKTMGHAPLHSAAGVVETALSGTVGKRQKAVFTRTSASAFADLSAWPPLAGSCQCVFVYIYIYICPYV